MVVGAFFDVASLEYIKKQHIAKDLYTYEVVAQNRYYAIWRFREEKPSSFSAYDWPNAKNDLQGKNKKSLEGFPEVKRFKVVMLEKIKLMILQEKSKALMKKKIIDGMQKNIYVDVGINIGG